MRGKVGLLAGIVFISKFSDRLEIPSYITEYSHTNGKEAYRLLDLLNSTSSEIQIFPDDNIVNLLVCFFF